jgi:hypothetical protein
VSEPVGQSVRDALAEADRRLGIEHVGGISWREAPIPRRWHRCWTQTSGHGVRRCACGALSYDDLPRWIEKNSRRRSADPALEAKR